MAAVFGAMFSILPCGMLFVMVIFQIVIWAATMGAIVFWILMLIDVAKRKVDDFPNKNENDRLLWILVVALASWVGALVYYFAVYKKQGKAK